MREILGPGTDPKRVGVLRNRTANLPPWTLGKNQNQGRHLNRACFSPEFEVKCVPHNLTILASDQASTRTDP